jgi:hypothetical protein
MIVNASWPRRVERLRESQKIGPYSISIVPPSSAFSSSCVDLLPVLPDNLFPLHLADMENNRTNIHELFSRGSTPPNQQNPHQQFPPPAQLPTSSSPNQIDALFQNITAPVTQQSPQQHQRQQVSPQQPVQSSAQGAANAHTMSNSAPVTPVMALTDGALAPSSSTSATASDRQSALLSLLAGPAVSNRQAVQAANVSLPTQVPTPPGSSQRSNASPGHNENQGKILLEQLMAGYVRSLDFSCIALGCVLRLMFSTLSLLAYFEI